MNTLKYAKNLEAVGFSREQAEAAVTMVNEAMESNLATKSDIVNIHAQFGDVRREMADLKNELKLDMARLETRLMLKLGGMLAGGFTVMTAVLAILINLRFRA